MGFDPSLDCLASGNVRGRVSWGLVPPPGFHARRARSPPPPYGDSEGARGAGCGAMLLASGSSFHFGFIISVPAHVRARSGELIKCF